MAVPVTVQIAVQGQGSVSSAVQGITSGLNSFESAVESSASATQALANSFDEVEQSAQGLGSTTEQAGDAFEDLGNKGANAATILESVERAGSQVSSAFSKVSLTFGAVSAGIVALGSSAVSSASEFEQLEARLRSVLGSSEAASQAFQQAVQAASTTPFDVQGVVQSSIVLNTFGVEAEENLDRVLNLGAAFGDLQGATLAFAKASSGSLEGFESLRNTFGISTSQLKDFGAEVSATGGILVRTEDQIDKARGALQRIIDLRFGGAVEAQAQTLQGAVSNLGDSVTNAAASFGEVLIPAVTAVSRTLSSFFDFLANLPEGVRQFIVFTGAAVAGLTGLAAAVTGAVAALGVFASTAAQIGTALIGLQGTLGTLATQFPAIASAVTRAAVAIRGLAVAAATTPITFASISAAASTAFATITAGAASAGSAVAGFGSTVIAALGPFGVAAAAAAAAIGVLTLAARNAAEESERLGDALQRASATAESSSRGFRSLAADLNEAFDIQLDFSRTSEAARSNLAALNQELANRSGREALDAFSALGRSVKDLETDFNNTRRQLDTTADRLNNLQAISNQAAQGFFNLTPAQRALFDELGGDISIVRAELQRTEIAFRDLSGTAQLLGRILEQVRPIAQGFQEASDEASRLDDFLKFAGRETDINRLRGSLDEINNALAASRQAFEAQAGAGSASTEALIDRLRTGQQVSAEEKEAIEEILELEQQREQFQKKISDAQKRASDETANAIKTEIDAKLEALGTDESNLARRAQIIRQGIAQIEDGTRQEEQLQRQLARTLEQIERQKTEAAKAGLDERVDAISDSIAEAERAANVSGRSIEVSVRQGISALQQFRQANQAAFADSPELVRAFNSELDTLNEKLREAQDIQVAEKFEQLQQSLEATIESAANAPARLEAVRAAINTLTAESNIAQTAEARERIQDEITRLKEEEKSITDQIKNSEEALATEVANLRANAIQEEIRLLEARQAAGEGVDNALAQSRQELLNLRIAAIREEEAEAIAAGENEALARERAALKIQSLQNAQTLRQFNEEQKRTENTRKAVDERVKINQQGANTIAGLTQGIVPSTLPSFFENFGQSAFAGRENSPSSNFAASAISRQQQFQIGATSSLDDRPSTVRAINQFDGTPLSERGVGTQTQAGEITNNNRFEFGDIVISGPDTSPEEFGNQVAGVVEERFNREGFLETPSSQVGA